MSSTPATTTVAVRAGVLACGTADHDVVTATWPSTGDEPTPFGAVVAVHGLGGSHLNWHSLGALLGRHGPVWAPDLAGFGRTLVAGRSSRLEDNLDLLAGFVDTVLERSGSDRPALVLGNSMGGLLALRLAARHPHLVGVLVLIDPAVPFGARGRPDPLVLAQFLAFLTPVVGERVLARRRAVEPERAVRATLDLVGVDPDRLDPQALEDAIAMAAWRRTVPGSDAALLTAARSLVRELTVSARRVATDVRAVSAPTLVLHGSRDRLVPVSAARGLAASRPDWSLEIYDDVGHVPQLEVPLRVAADVNAFVDARAALAEPAAGATDEGHDAVDASGPG